MGEGGLRRRGEEGKGRERSVGVLFSKILQKGTFLNSIASLLVSLFSLI